MDVLARHFPKEQTIEGQAAQPGLVDYDMAVSEWIILRSLTSTAYRGMNWEQFVSSLLAKHADVLPALCVVVSAAAVLPVTNVSAERGFSTQTGFWQSCGTNVWKEPSTSWCEFLSKGCRAARWIIAGLCSCGDLSDPTAFYELDFGAHGKLSPASVDLCLDLQQLQFSSVQFRNVSNLLLVACTILILFLHLL